MFSWSIRNQIFTIVFILAAISVVVCAVGLYAVRGLDDAVAEVDITARRLADIDDVAAQISDVIIGVREVLLTTDETKKADDKKAIEEKVVIIDKQMKAIGSVTRLSTEWRSLESEWDKHKTIVGNIVSLSMQNTTEHASALSRGQAAEHWNKMVDSLGRLAQAAEGTGSGEGLLAARDAYEALGLVVSLELSEKRSILNSGRPEVMAEIRQEGEKFHQDLSAVMARLEKELVSPGLGSANDIYQRELKSAAAEGQKLWSQVLSLAEVNSSGQAVELLATQCNPTRAREGAILKDILAKQKDFFQAASDSADMYSSQAFIILLTVTGVGLLLGVGLAWLMMARLSRKLTEIIDDLSGRSSELGRIASEVSQASSSLAEASTEQAASLEETSATLEEMSSMTKSNSENATRTSESTSQTVKLIEGGGRSVQTVTKAMTEISSSSEQISQIIKTIEGIAFQTNLLALNAAVEAARAGEAGQGFAVVADEVRNLALRSAQAAKDTSDLIQSTVNLVKDGSQNVDELAASFSQIEKGAQEVGRLIVEITSATNEQALGVSQVNTAVAQMDKVTQSNAAMAEESASSSVSLSDQTYHLDGLVRQLSALVHGGRAEADSPPPLRGSSAVRPVSRTLITHDDPF